MTFCFSRTIDKIEVCGTYRTIYLRTSNYDMLKSILLENWNATLDITFKYSFVFYHYCFNCVSPLLTFLYMFDILILLIYYHENDVCKIFCKTKTNDEISDCECLYNLIYFISKCCHLLSAHLFR